MSQLTTIVTRIENDPPEWVATTPHVPELRAAALREHLAVNELMAAIRRYRDHFEAAGKPVPWIVEPTVARDADSIVRRISGLWPPEVTPPEVTPTEVTPQKVTPPESPRKSHPRKLSDAR